MNAKFARVEQVRKFRLIEQKLTAEDEELTPTMKLKRKLVTIEIPRPDRGDYAGRRHVFTPACRASGHPPLKMNTTGKTRHEAP